ncbi:MAG: hypothetical protein AAGI08_13040, partial [Bacteroidota bacterium]
LLSIDVMLPGQETTWGIEDKRETRQTQRVPGRTMLELRGPAGIDSRSVNAELFEAAEVGDELRVVETRILSLWQTQELRRNGFTVRPPEPAEPLGRLIFALFFPLIAFVPRDKLASLYLVFTLAVFWEAFLILVLWKTFV